jgi:Ribbon-helix-helix protein, copG family
MTERIYGRTKSGKVVTDADIERFADEAEAGYDVDEILARRGRRGRPTVGSGPASVESVRLDPELRDELAHRAEAEGVSTSDLIRRALLQYLASR